jgi:hypothetical protein
MTHWFSPIRADIINLLIEYGLLGTGEPWMWGEDIFGDNCGLRFSSWEEMREEGYLGIEIP